MPTPWVNHPASSTTPIRAEQINQPLTRLIRRVDPDVPGKRTVDNEWLVLWHPEWEWTGNGLVMVGSNQADGDIGTVFRTNLLGQQPEKLIPPGNPLYGRSQSDPSHGCVDFPFEGRYAFVVCRPENLDPRCTGDLTQSDVYAWVAPTQALTRLTDNLLWDADPYYNHDRSQVIFCRQTGPQFEFGIFKRVPDASSPEVVITNDPRVTNGSPAYPARTGPVLYFPRFPSPPSDRRRIWQVNEDGTGMSQITVGAGAYDDEYPAI